MLNDQDTVVAGVGTAIAALDGDGGTSAAEAIMTTDTVAKTSVAVRDGWSAGGDRQGRWHARTRTGHDARVPDDGCRYLGRRC